MTAAYLLDIAFHYGIDMFGALTLYLLMRGCSNPEHTHTGIKGMLTGHPWLTQCLVALAAATVLVHSFAPFDIIVHFGIDMAGALTLSWIFSLRSKGGPLAALARGRNAWATQSVFALAVAFATVHTIG